MSTSEVEQSREHWVVEKGADLSHTITTYRQHLLEQLRQEEASEDTEHVIDWLEDSWSTFDILKERFGEARAWQLYTADLSPASKHAGHDPCFPMREEHQSGASYAHAT